MKERLGKLCFVSPPANTPWTGPPKEASSRTIQRADGVEIELDLPLFWYDPPWEAVPTDSADVIATAVGQLGVIVSALRSDLSTLDGESGFHEPLVNEADGQSNVDAYLSRIVPYRPERYGLSDRDFDGARIVDVRLTMNRCSSGRFAFSPQQVERWEATPEDAPLAGGGWVPAASFPPDVGTFDDLRFKFGQLRLLAPNAAVVVSLNSHRLVTELGAVLRNSPDGVILRLDELQLSGLELARTVQQTRRWMDEQNSEHVPLWIVPGEVSVDDVVKLIALGASAVAVDSWCDEIIDQAIALQNSSTSSRGYPSLSASHDRQLVDLIELELGDQTERVSGLLHSLQYQPSGQQLASLSSDWARALGVASWSVPFDTGT